MCPRGSVFRSALGALLLSLFPAAAGPAPEPPPPTTLERGRTYTAWFYAGEVEKVWEKMSDPMRAGLGSLEAVREFREQVARQLGDETGVIDERVSPAPGLEVYVRSARFERLAQPIEVTWAVDEDGAVQGFFIRPTQQPAPSAHLEYRTKTALRLPFDGRWYVFWGGRTLEENYHVASVDQRFAYDFVVREAGSTHAGDGSANEQYLCWGRPILAPAAGTVAVAVDGVEDNRPGEMNPAVPPGNHVVIDHGNGEFSFLAHLRKGSVAVAPSQAVEAGVPLGVCGNSGNSSEPHLHYHLQTNAVFNGGEGLPAFFREYAADGETVGLGEPRRGQTVEPAPRPAAAAP